MTPPRPPNRDRCHVCSLKLPAWLPVPKPPDGAMQSITNAGACGPPAWGT